MARKKRFFSLLTGLLLVLAALFGVVYFIGYSDFFSVKYYSAVADSIKPLPPSPVLDKAAYDAKLLKVANLSSSTLALLASTTLTSAGVPASTTARNIWPAKGDPYPNAGAILPFSRIVAYYGNFYSTGMGVLGEYPPPQMLAMLASTTAQWAAADPSTPVIPAIDYIAVTAQGSAGQDGMYRARMPASQIEEAISLAAQVHGLVILDVQVGLSNLQTEIPLLEPYLKLPQVELAVDPEFAMHGGAKPGTVIGSFDAADINYAANYLAGLVRENNLPPKILIVHRFTEDMVTHAEDITPLPEVEVVMDMDGWGSQSKKIGTYTNIIAAEPVQFTGFKLFYKNDLKAPSAGLMTPAQVLNLSPQPMFIQYQ